MDFMPLIPFLGVSVPESLVLYYMALTLSAIKRPFYYLVALALVTSLFSYTVRLLPLVFGAHTLLELGLIVILVKHSFHIPWKLALTVTVISGIILGVAESISVPLLTRTFSFTLGQAISDPLMRIVFTLPHLAFLLGLTYHAARRGWRIRFLERMISAGQRSERNDFFGKAYLLLLFLVQTLMLVLLNFSFHIYSARVFPTLKLSTLVAISSAIIMASVLATILVVNYLLKVAEREARLETELRHIKEMQSLSLKMRSQHHDFYNHLTAIYGYLKARHYIEAEHYIATLYENVRQLENLMGISPPELGAVLSLKLEEAKTQGIEFRWQVNVKHDVLPVYLRN